MSWRRNGVQLVMAASCMLLALCLVSQPVAADDATVGATGGEATPLQSSSVVMVKEDVRVRLYYDWAAVDATFTFRNEGPRADLTLGFPQEIPGNTDQTSDPELFEFTASVDGQSLPVQFKRGLTSSLLPGFLADWYTFPVSFDAGQTRTVRNTYLGRNGFDSIGNTFFKYVLRTGKLWKDSIGSVDVSVELADGMQPEDFNLGPTTLEVRDNTIVWHSDQLEPEPVSDIFMYFDARRARVPVLGLYKNDESSTLPDLLCGMNFPADHVVDVYAGTVKTGSFATADGHYSFRGDFRVPEAVLKGRERVVPVWAVDQETGKRSVSSLLVLPPLRQAETQPGAQPPVELPAAGGRPEMPWIVSALRLILAMLGFA